MDQSALEPSERLAALGIVLPAARKPIANFLTCKRSGDLLYLSGQGPVNPEGVRFTGKVGGAVSKEQAYEHARMTTINLLAVINDFLGSIDQVRDIVKVIGFVNGEPSFTDHPFVINGCSDLLISVFGPDRGMHARSAIGAGSLPNQITVEIEMIVSAPQN